MMANWVGQQFQPSQLVAPSGESHVLGAVLGTAGQKLVERLKALTIFHPLLVQAWLRKALAEAACWKQWPKTSWNSMAHFHCQHWYLRMAVWLARQEVLMKQQRVEGEQRGQAPWVALKAQSHPPEAEVAVQLRVLSPHAGAPLVCTSRLLICVRQ